MATIRKTPSMVRAEAERLARRAAEERFRDGDPEGAGVIVDLADEIAAIWLTRSTTK